MNYHFNISSILKNVPFFDSNALAISSTTSDKRALNEY